MFIQEHPIETITDLNDKLLLTDVYGIDYTPSYVELNYDLKHGAIVYPVGECNSMRFQLAFTLNWDKSANEWWVTAHRRRIVDNQTIVRPTKDIKYLTQVSRKLGKGERYTRKVQLDAIMALPALVNEMTDYISWARKLLHETALNETSKDLAVSAI